MSTDNPGPNKDEGNDIFEEMDRFLAPDSADPQNNQALQSCSSGGCRPSEERRRNLPSETASASLSMRLTQIDSGHPTRDEFDEHMKDYADYKRKTYELFETFRRKTDDQDEIFARLKADNEFYRQRLGDANAVMRKAKLQMQTVEKALEELEAISQLLMQYPPIAFLLELLRELRKLLQFGGKDDKFRQLLTQFRDVAKEAGQTKQEYVTLFKSKPIKTADEATSTQSLTADTLDDPAVVLVADLLAVHGEFVELLGSADDSLLSANAAERDKIAVKLEELDKKLKSALGCNKCKAVEIPVDAIITKMKCQEREIARLTLELDEQKLKHETWALKAGEASESVLVQALQSHICSLKVQIADLRTTATGTVSKQSDTYVPKVKYDELKDKLREQHETITEQVIEISALRQQVARIGNSAPRYISDADNEEIYRTIRDVRTMISTLRALENPNA